MLHACFREAAHPEKTALMLLTPWRLRDDEIFGTAIDFSDSTTRQRVAVIFSLVSGIAAPTCPFMKD
jgi:hypothetical protein